MYLISTFNASLYDVGMGMIETRVWLIHKRILKSRTESHPHEIKVFVTNSGFFSFWTFAAHKPERDKVNKDSKAIFSTGLFCYLYVLIVKGIIKQKNKIKSKRILMITKDS